METYDVFASYHLSPVKARVSAGAAFQHRRAFISPPLLGRTFRPLRVRLEGRIKRLAAWNARGHVKERRVGGAHRHSAWATSRCPPYPRRGMARRKAQTYGVRISFWETRRAPLGAPHTLFIGALPRFALLERINAASHAERVLICGVLTTTPGPASVRSLRREAQDRTSQPAPGRTSYWVRGELRCRPSAPLRRSPQAPHPVPLQRRLAKAPLKGRGEATITEVRRAGISAR